MSARCAVPPAAGWHRQPEYRSARLRKGPACRCVTRSRVPCRGHDALIILDLAVLDHDPMREHAARCLVEAEAPDLALRERRPIERCKSPLAMLSTSICHWIFSASCSTAQRTARAAMRPMSNAGRPTGSGSRRPSGDLPAWSGARFVGSWPAAYIASTLASGPTCARFPWKVGALIQEYFPSS